MGLQGNLEDLPLLDIIQMVSFSRKTGYLSIEMEGGEGAIVFHGGLVVAAFTTGSPPSDPRIAQLSKDAREKAVRARLGFALEQLARLREGAFGFELTEEIPLEIGGRDIRLETLARGINPQEMLLELAQGLDDDRAQSTAAVEASFADASGGALEEPPIVPAAATEADLLEGTGPDPLAGVRTVPLPKIPRELVDTSAVDAARPAEEPPPSPAEAVSAQATPSLQLPLDEELPHAHTILLVDDEADVRQILGRHFEAHGYRVEEAGDPEGAAKVAGRLRESATPFVLVSDLGMPATGGASFYGGFEVMKRLWKMNLRPPTLMMTESLSQSLKLRAKQMGVLAFVFKPTLSKLNAVQFEADLGAFAGRLLKSELPRLAETAALRQPRQRRRSSVPAPGAAPEASEASPPLDFLKRRLVELRHGGGDANQIAILVMKVAEEFFERALLFVVKNGEARGLGGFGVAPREETLNLLARQVTIPLGEPSLFRDVALSRRPFSGPLPADRWTGHLLGRIGRFQSKGAVLLPLVAHRETIALLFGDNPASGREATRLTALEVFVEQAGIALENVFLQRKLQALRDKGVEGPA